MPNIDLVKVAIVVVLVIVVVALIGFITNLDIGGGTGEAAFEQLGTKPQSTTGATGDWAPLDVITVLIPTLFGMLAGDGLPINFPALIAGVFAAALAAAGVALLVKMIARVIGS